MEEKNRKFHFIAIGGIGMSGLAKYLLELGMEVSGSDVQASKYTKKLEEIGAKIYIGHNADYVQSDMLVVASTAIRENNPEKMKAKKLGLKVYHRSDILEMISQGLGKEKKTEFIGFSGTHGKTTTSGMCAYVLEKAGFEPSYCIGGIIPELNTNAKASKGKHFVAELDESDGTIVKYSPNISVINNLEIDHVDFYKDGFAELLDTFKTHLSKMGKDSKIIINKDCGGNRELMEKNPQSNFITFGIEDAINLDYGAENISYNKTNTEFDVLKNGEKLGAIKLIVPGKHNVYNALGVISALVEDGIEFEKIAPHFETFCGMGRRYQFVAEFNGITVIDDYAHHPSEIKTTLQSAKNCTDGRLVAIFQPHRFSRLQGLWDDFLKAFDCADKLFVVDIYAASEDPIEGVSAEIFASKIGEKAVYAGGTIEESAKKIAPLLKSGDTVITLGAGDITKIGKLLKI